MAFSLSIPTPSIFDFLFGGLALCSIIISWYYFFKYFSKVKLSKPDENNSLPPVSLVVVARNEIKNLQTIIPILLAQEYPQFELIIADDGSTDGSSEWITEIRETDSRIKLVLLDPEYVKMHGKKIALTLAYKKSVHNHFILTDADCTPASNQWLKQMASQFNSKTEIVIGYSPYYKSKGLLNKMIRFETLITALHYLGFAIMKKPYMGVGRNLAYTRAVYDRNHGFSSHSHIPAGDDDLFVQEAANDSNTAVCLYPESFVFSIPKSTFKSWRQQKRRHLWVGKFYSSKVKNQLMWFPLAQFLIAGSIIPWFFFGSWFVYPCALILIKLIPEWIIFGMKAKKLTASDLIFLFPFYFILYILLYFLSGIGAFFAKKPKW